jgi:hypothetical protein
MGSAECCYRWLSSCEQGLHRFSWFETKYLRFESALGVAQLVSYVSVLFHNFIFRYIVIYP